MDQKELERLMRERTEVFRDELAAMAAVPAEVMRGFMELAAMQASGGGERVSELLPALLAGSAEMRAVTRALGRAFLAMGAEPEN